MRYFFEWFRGIVFVEFCGALPERFFNICRNRKIPLYEVSDCVTAKGTVTVAKIRLRDYYKLRSIARKTHCIPYVRRRIGVPFFIRKYRHRIFFALGALWFLGTIWMLSKFVWDISVYGGFVHTEEEILSYLRENNIVCGMKSENVDCTEIERRLRIDYPDIGWVSAELKGTKLYLRISETDMPAVREEEGPAHIRATSDGIVEHIVCRSGTPLVKAGDVVKKGDILVSGVISVIGDNEMVMNRYPVKADADIQLKTTKQYSYKMVRKKEEKVFSHQVKKGYEIFYGTKKIFSYMPSHSYTNYDIITEDAVLSLHEHFPLPIRIRKTQVLEYESRLREYSEEEIRSLAAKALERYVNYLEENGTVVTETRVETKVTGEFAYTEGKLVLLSEAWEWVAVKEEEWRLQKPDEYNGIIDGSSSTAQ